MKCNVCHKKVEKITDEIVLYLSKLKGKTFCSMECYNTWEARILQKFCLFEHKKINQWTCYNCKRECDIVTKRRTNDNL